MVTFDPCSCWRLPDGAFTVAVWSTAFAVIQLIIFGWQMAAISYERDRAANYMMPYSQAYGSYAPSTWFGGGGYGGYWPGYEQSYYNAIFIIQIVALIISIFLFFTSLMLIFGVRSWNRSMVWPWLINMGAMIVICIAYCITWWAGYARSYWVVLTIIQILGVFANIYCMVVIYAFYKYVEEESGGRRRGGLKGGGGGAGVTSSYYGPIQQQVQPPGLPTTAGIHRVPVGYVPSEGQRMTPSSYPVSQRMTPMSPTQPAQQQRRYTPAAEHLATHIA